MISFGADFLGTWNSPVAQSIGYGTMRKGRPGQRGKFVHVEPRLSQTAANADEWIPCKPGTEGVFALSLAQVILREKLRPAVSRSRNRGLVRGIAGLRARESCGPNWRPGGQRLRASRTKRRRTRPRVALIGGAATAQTNGLFTALAVNALNTLLGSVGKPGGILFSAAAKPRTREGCRFAVRR